MRPTGRKSLVGLVLVLAVVLVVNAIGQDRSPDWSTKLSPEVAILAHSSAEDSSEMVPVIICSYRNRDFITEKLNATGARNVRSLAIINSYAAEVPKSSLETIADDSGTALVSLDRETWLTSERYDYNLLRATTGAENVTGRDGLGAAPGRGDALTDYIRSLPDGPNGSGVAIAVFDSGIHDRNSLHQDFGHPYNQDGSRVRAHVDFVSGESQAIAGRRELDPYGHGTHVAGVAAGTGRESLQSGSGNFYPGMAFGADLVDLRVIDGTGRGRISDTIAAIECMIRNRFFYNIRVANFSLGAEVTQSYKTDPLCQAVEKAVRAGIVCVAAAGNFGKDAEGKTVYGSILAPGNDPLAITVGATNTWGSAIRSDDTIASYSSRGPTLVDRIDKPDLVAPGTLIRSSAPPFNYLAANNDLTVQATQGECVYMWLSGTSVAAPVVSGTAALMLSRNPGLSPAMVKSILQFTAQPLRSSESTNPLLRMLSEGAGCINVDAAVTLAGAFRRDAAERQVGAPLLIGDINELRRLYATRDIRTGEFITTIAGEPIGWGKTLIYSEGVAYWNNSSLLAFRTSGWQVTPKSVLFNGYLKIGGLISPGGSVLDQGRLLTEGSTLDQGVVLDQSRIFAANAWVLAGETRVLTNTSAARADWSASLMDQSVIASGTVLDQNIWRSRVIADGDDAKGIEIQFINSETHPLFPRLKRVKR